MTVAAVLLCGGTSRRFGAGDKTAQPLGSDTVLGHLLAALPSDWPVVCVGAPRPLERLVTWASEDPPLGGPLAGLAAGVAALPTGADVVFVAAGDQPFAGVLAADLVRSLEGSEARIDAVAVREPDGRAQLLLAAYRRDRLTPLLAGDLTGRGVHRRLASLRVRTMAADPIFVLDVDTREDLDAARRAAGRFEA